MAKTRLTIDGEKFLINGKPVYSEIPGSNPAAHGLLMNARFIQGIFDSENRHLFHRYGKVFDPDANTDELIAALPAWYAKGLRAITVGVQGGGPCFTVKGSDIRNSPYSPDGTRTDPTYLGRLDRLIRACDKIGMVVIVSYFYGSNTTDLGGARAVLNIVKNMSAFLRDYNNVIIEVANEYDISVFTALPIIHEAQGMVALMDLAREYSGGLHVGCSGGGGSVNEEVCRGSDVVLIHGNGESRSQLYNHIRTARRWGAGKPVVINEDSQAIGQLQVCRELGVSWGYYNNMTKQEPPVYWGITQGEDRFFAWRMADMIGIPQEDIPEDEQYYFQGFEGHMHCNGLRFPRVASLYPESVNFVRFFENGEHVYTCYDESFQYNFRGNWFQGGAATKDGDIWEAEISLRDGGVKRLQQTVKNL